MALLLRHGMTKTGALLSSKSEIFTGLLSHFIAATLLDFYI
jgi:hypothetical protein